MRLFLALLALSAAPGATAAQDPQPASPGLEALLDGQTSRAGLSERLATAAIGLEPSGEPRVSEGGRRDEPLLIAPLRLVEEGRLDAAIATPDHRMAAGTLVTRRRFAAGRAEQTDQLEAWCGVGESRRGSRWSPAAVCMVHTPDGQANLGVPPYGIAPWWLVSSLTFSNMDHRAPRVSVTSVEPVSEFSYVVSFVRVRDGEMRLSRRLIGPGLDARRPAEIPLRTLDAPMTGRTAVYNYDGLELTLTANRYLDAVTATSQRVAPPVDQRLADEGGLAHALRDQVEEDAGPVQPTPGVIGGVRLRPEALVVTTGPVSRGGVLASGEMHHARTGRIPREVALEGSMNPLIRAGAVAHRVEILRTSPIGARSLSTFWCMPVSALTVFGRQDDQQTCFRRRGGRYEGLWPSSGRSWLTTTDRSATPLSRFTSTLPVEESESDLIGAMEVRLELYRLGPTSAVLRILARRDDEEAVVMTVSRPVENGVAVFPLWTHRLVLTVSGDQATAALTADGDGSGLAEVGVYP